MTPPARLEPATVAALRDALARMARSGGEDDALLRTTLVALSEEARAKQIAPEALLLVLKELWGGLDEVRAVADPALRAALLQRIVTRCIKQYFA